MQLDRKVIWVKGYNGWLHFDNLNLQQNGLNDTYGIYILWTTGKIIKIGSGRIRDELAKDKTNKEICSHENLMITWCTVSKEDIEGTKKYLVEKFKPSLIGNGIQSEACSISLNDPWKRDFLNLSN